MDETFHEVWASGVHPGMWLGSFMTPFLDGPPKNLVFSFSPSFNSGFRTQPSSLFLSIWEYGAQESFGEQRGFHSQGGAALSILPSPVPPCTTDTAHSEIAAPATCQRLRSSLTAASYREERSVHYFNQQLKAIQARLNGNTLQQAMRSHKQFSSRDWQLESTSHYAQVLQLWKHLDKCITE